MLCTKLTRINFFVLKFQFIIHFQMILHGHNLEDMAKYFDVEGLPEDFGGKAPPYSNEARSFHIIIIKET